MPLSLRYIEETDVLASVTYCGVSGGAAVSAWRYRRCVRVVRLAAHVRGDDSADGYRAVSQRCAPSGGAARLVSGRGVGHGEQRCRRQPLPPPASADYVVATGSARGAAVSPRVGGGCSGGVQRQQLPRGSWRAWRTDREESARGCLTDNTTYYYSLRDINCRQQRHRNSTEGNTPSAVSEAPKCVRWMELCVFHREGEKADNFWENGDNLVKSTWDAARA